MADGKNNKLSSLSILEKVYLGILLVIFGGIVLHAPLSVGLGTLWPDYSLLIKAWKEILMVIAAVVGGIILLRGRQLAIFKEPLMIAIGAYIALHLILVTIFARGLASSTAGLMIDLRYIVFFVLVYIAARLYPGLRRPFLNIGIAGALAVVVFALLQVFVLPIDALKHIGYNINTIVPYLTVDQNYDFIRINSTLRGPNPLGAYAGIILTILVAFVIKHRVKKDNWRTIMIGVLAVGGVVALWASYSRSALVAACVSIAVVLIVTIARKLSRRTWIISCVVLLALIGGLALARDSHFVSNVILHENPGESNQINSNEGHIDSLVDGAHRFTTQPLGSGVGSTGSASLRGDSPLIIENQYLFVAHEAGWAGLLLFMLIFAEILRQLWVRRQNYVALGILASGIGLALIGLLLPVWADDTVAIVWWGLAGLAVGSRRYMVDGNKDKKDRNG